MRIRETSLFRLALFVVMVISVLLIVVALTADQIGFGGDPGFGTRQMALAVAGVVLLLISLEFQTGLITRRKNTDWATDINRVELHTISGDKLPLVINAKKTTIFLGVVVFLVVCAGIVAQVIGLPRPEEGLAQLLTEEFILNQEANVPTYLSTLLLLLAAVLLGVIALFKRRDQNPFARHWTALAVIFLYLSFDEFSQIHETMGGALVKAINVTRFLNIGWVAIALPLVIIVVGLFSRFIYHLPKRYAILFVVSAAIYFGGVIGVEIPGNLLAYRYGPDDPTFLMFTIVEETLEMVGLLVFVYTLLEYLREYLSEARIRFI